MDLGKKRCRALTTAAITFGVVAVAAMLTAAFEESARLVVLHLIVAVVWTGAAVMAGTAAMIRRWLVPLTAAYRLGQMEKQQGDDAPRLELVSGD